MTRFISAIRYYLSYYTAKAYQFCATFPDWYGNSIAVPTRYDLMSWWSITDFLCLFSNLLYPDKVADGEVSGAMIKAALDKMPEETREKMLKELSQYVKEDSNEDS